MKRIAWVLTLLAVTVGCSSAHHASSAPGSAGTTPTTTIRLNAGPQLPHAVSAWLRAHYSTPPYGRATSADWVLTTHGQAATITSGAEPADPSPVYLFDLHGSFKWEHSCPPRAPRSACVSIGKDEVFTVDPVRLQVLDFGVESRAPNLAQFGAVGHVAL